MTAGVFDICNWLLTLCFSQNVCIILIIIVIISISKSGVGPRLLQLLVINFPLLNQVAASCCSHSCTLCSVKLQVSGVLQQLLKCPRFVPLIVVCDSVTGLWIVHCCLLLWQCADDDHKAGRQTAATFSTVYSYILCHWQSVTDQPLVQLIFTECASADAATLIHLLSSTAALTKWDEKRSPFHI